MSDELNPDREATKGVQEVPCDTEYVSDGFHDFRSLYAHRIALWIALCRELSESRKSYEETPWRSRLHSDGSAIEGWFVLGVGASLGLQITYHLPDDDWDRTGFARTLPRAPEFDGHTSSDVIERLRGI